MPRKAQIRWSPRIELTKAEESVCKRCKRNGRLYAFFRRHRHELFDEAFQAELAEMYADSAKGHPPVPPALLAMVTVLQAACGVSDEGAVNQAIFDRRWQMVLDSDSESAPFSQGALVSFRRRLIEHGLQEKLILQSVTLAKKTGGFGFKQLRVALDSAPLWGAGRVEDTFNLIGHALEVVAQCAASAANRNVEDVYEGAEMTLVGRSSVKAQLDIDWDDKEAQHRALQALLAEVMRLRQWLSSSLSEQQLRASPLREAVEQLARVIEQDLEPDPDRGGERITRGTAKDRQISITDPEMRHGRKSRSVTIKGFKRFIARDLDHGLILAVTVQGANRPEHEATPTLRRQVQVHGATDVLFIDRGFLASEWTAKHHEAGGRVVCRPWTPRNGGRYTKGDFDIDMVQRTVTCPAAEQRPIVGNVARFPKRVCAPCPRREKCTRAKGGRSISIHAQEPLLQDLSARKKTPEGRAELRERVPVEHSLAHICSRQGRHARYVGIDKNIFDLCRYAFIENCFAIDRLERAA